MVLISKVRKAPLGVELDWSAEGATKEDDDAIVGIEQTWLVSRTLQNTDRVQQRGVRQAES